jgi:hypothetical protein
MVARPGGAILTARMISAALGAPVRAPRLENLDALSPEQALRSLVILDQFSITDSDKARVWRVGRFCGYHGPANGDCPQFAVDGDGGPADIVVIDDAGNGFRETEACWPAALKSGGKKPIVILKMSSPLNRGRLWEFLHKEFADKLIVVLTADSLRAEGVNISRRLSWERTAMDFAWQIACDREMIYTLGQCANLVVRFNLDGAVHYSRRGGMARTRLYYDPLSCEGGFRDTCSGDMMGFGSAFTAAIAAQVARGGVDALGEGIRQGLLAARRLMRLGFGRDGAAMDYACAKSFQAIPKEARIVDIDVPVSDSNASDPNFWSILHQLTQSRMEEVAYNTVIAGKDPALDRVPVGVFGFLKTLDRCEIESFRSIRNLIGEYMETPKPPRPLSLAVFGPPGSGKSFGVVQVARSIAGGRIEKCEFNVSQFNSPADLIKALHQVRDIVLMGRVPLVFFDEFDAGMGGERLAWLRYFLIPMQDGQFRDGSTIHPIGKAIFVFAGGTSSTFGQFSRDGRDPQNPADADELRQFSGAKGPDFVSRLRGHVNILGPNPVDANDRFYLIRRAILLRVLLSTKAPHLLDGAGCVHIDEGVLRAMIKVHRYTHGVRSMEAIIDMSMLSGRRIFEQSALPPRAQLPGHVDAEVFCGLVDRDVLLGAAREQIARSVHEEYVLNQKANKPADDPSMQPWDKLAEHLKESNRMMADSIPGKLRRIGYGYRPAGTPALEFPGFVASEMEILAELEHDRWVSERLQNGWSLGNRDIERRTSPYLVPWAELDDKVKQWDRDAVIAIPKILTRAGFEIYRLD